MHDFRGAILTHSPPQVSSLKSKLKKQSTATGSEVARAFLRSQAALFGSYRDALRYKPVSLTSVSPLRSFELIELLQQILLDYVLLIVLFICEADLL